MSYVSLLAATAVVLATAFVLAECLRLRRAVDMVLATYLLAFAEIVVVSLLLSPGRWLTAPNLWIAILVVAAAAVGARFLVLGRAPLFSFRPALRVVREVLRDPLVLVLGVVVLGAFAYVAALILGTPPNDYDALWYHLARAAFWKQQHGVAYIPGANDARLNGFPPNAEILQAFTMILGKTERFAGFVQFSALVATMVAVAGIARRIGLTVWQALFGALLFATLPVVILQSSTSLNDLVFCAPLACAAYFLFTWRPATLALVALAVGLAIGTKITAVLALPLLALIGAVRYPPRRWLWLVLVGVSGIVLGSYWYLLNRSTTGKFGGDIANAKNATTVEHGNTSGFVGTVAHFLRLLVDAFDPSGAVGRDRFLYLVAAAVVLVLGLRTRGRARGWFVAAAALVALPLAFRLIDHGLLHGYQKLWVHLDRHDLAFLGFDKDLTKVSPFQSWYGPLGFILVVACSVLAWLRRRRLGWVAVVLALSPLIWLVLQAATTFYSLFDGRYVVFAVALGAVLWGLVLEIRWLAWAATGIAVVAVALSLVHYFEKPSGVNALGGSAPTSVWDRSRAEVMAANLKPGEAAIVAALDRRAKAGDEVALAIRREDVSYPFFGAEVDRRVSFVQSAYGNLIFPGALDEIPRGTKWLVLAPGYFFASRAGGVRTNKAFDTFPWRRVAAEKGWALYESDPIYRIARS